MTDAFEALSTREKVLCLCAVIAGILFLGIQVAITPLLDEKNDLQNRSLLNAQEISELTAAEQALQTRLARNPNIELRNQKQQLEADLAGLQDSLRTKVTTLLSPRETQTLLRSLLDDYHGLSLVSARNLAPSVLAINRDDASEEANEVAQSVDDNTVKVFEHGFEITLSGSYFETRDYLRRLEELEGFYWRRLNYEVMEYPDAEVTLGITTLSIDEAWIGG